jgi:bifunctional DNA-binding transcriptional regulator/antitoxin component of YhaV-PrlF toxin-antitoxin module
MRRLLGLKAHSKVLIEERDGGIFIRSAKRGRSIVPIDYLPFGAITMNENDYRLNAVAGEDDVPHL